MNDEESSLTARAAVHAALSDVHRLAIVDELALSDRSPSELRSLLGIPSNLLAHHTRVLEQVGLVEQSASDGDGRRRYLRLTPGASTDPRLAVLRARNVVFVCTHNSARSQLAAALWNAGHPVRATSAGTHPRDAVHPAAVAAGERAGVDLSAARPRALDELGEDPDLVITVCDRAHEELAGNPWRQLHWSLPDPSKDGRRRAFDGSVAQLRRRIANVGPAVVPAGT